MMSVDRKFVDPYHLGMRKVLLSGAAALCLLLIFVDVSIDFRFSMPQDVQVVDAAREAQYQACVDERDAQIHEIAFGTIDNPDVQREFLSTHKDQAKAECRLEYPARMTIVAQPFQLRLLAFEYRFQ
jgi:hypothetical protein